MSRSRAPARGLLSEKGALDVGTSVCTQAPPLTAGKMLGQPLFSQSISVLFCIVGATTGVRSGIVLMVPGGPSQEMLEDVPPPLPVLASSLHEPFSLAAPAVCLAQSRFIDLHDSAR